MTVFPQELIDLFVEACADQGVPLCPLLSVSTAFRAPARRLLFSAVTIEWQIIPDLAKISICPRSLLLLELLCQSPGLFKLFRTVVVYFKDLTPWTRNYELTHVPLPSAVVSVITVLSKAPIRHFSLIGSFKITLDIFASAARKPLTDIHRKRSLRSLKIQFIEDIPPSFIFGRMSEDSLSPLMIGPFCTILASEDEDDSLIDSSPTLQPPHSAAQDKSIPSLKVIRLRERGYGAENLAGFLNTLVANAPLLEELILVTSDLVRLNLEELATFAGAPPGLRTLAHLRRFSWVRRDDGTVSEMLHDFVVVLKELHRLGSPLVDIVVDVTDEVSVEDDIGIDGCLDDALGLDHMPSVLANFKRAIAEFTSLQSISIGVHLPLQHGMGLGEPT